MSNLVQDLSSIRVPAPLYAADVAKYAIIDLRAATIHPSVHCGSGMLLITCVANDIRMDGRPVMVKFYSNGTQLQNTVRAVEYMRALTGQTPDCNKIQYHA